MPQDAGVRVNAWEVSSDEEALRALAGHSTRARFEADRQQRAREVAEWCQVGLAKNGFEIGSGEGTVARLLSSSCAGLDCNDISESFLAKASGNCSACSNVRFFLIDRFLDHLPDESYDFGYSLNVFIHFNPYDIFNYLRSVKRVLKTDGVFYFDACTLGPGTAAVFREHAGMYARAPETIRGLLNFNSEGLLRAPIEEAGLALSERSSFAANGWFKVLARKPAAATPES